jgi:hypothetical protein
LAILEQLVMHIEAGNVRPGDIRTYTNYGRIHSDLGLETQGQTVGQSLSRQGLADLAIWTKEFGHPAVTGLIVDRTSGLPGDGYFRLYLGTDEPNFRWWEEQIRLSLAYDWRQFLPSDVPITPTASDINAPPEERVAVNTYRILRDTELARRVKTLHNYECQICGHTIHLPGAQRYAESHHIQPLGSPHNGPDKLGNIICVCPNHHAALDYAAIAISLAALRTHPQHMIGTEFVDYHNKRLTGIG